MTKHRERYRATQGVDNEGYEFEMAMVSFFCFHLCYDPHITDFKIALYDEEFQPFDDIVIDISTRDRTLKFALQLKHVKDKLVLHPNHLSKNGKMNLNKYFKFDFTKTDHVVLFTNGIVDEEMTIGSFAITTKTGLDDVKCLDTCDGDASHIFDITDEENDHRITFFTSQKSRVDIEEATKNKFKEKFELEEDDALGACQKFRNFFLLWKKGHFGSCKLDRNDIKMKIAEILLLEHIVDCTPSMRVPNSKTDLLRRIVNDFTVTIVDGDLSISSLCNISVDFDVETVGKEFLIETKNLSLVLWRLRLFPLILKIVDNKQLVCQLIEDLQDENLSFVLIGTVSSSDVSADKVFESLDQMKTKDYYEEVVSSFKLSVQNQTPISLQYLIQCNSKFATIITLKELLLMLDDDLVVGDNDDVLPSPYIPRRLLTSIISVEAVEQLPKDLFVISGMTKAIRTRLGACKFWTSSEFVKRITNGKAFPPKSVIISENHALDVSTCLKYQHSNVHYLQVLDQNHLHVVCSRTGSDLKKFQVFDETQLLGLASSGVNLVCARPGMGKSTMMKYLKLHCPPGYWTVKDSFEIFADGTSFEAKVRNCFAKKQRVVFFFGIDNLYSESLTEVAQKIVRLSEQKFKVWVFACDYLKEKLEAQFGVTAMDIDEFSEAEQEDYIQRRLTKQQSEVLPNFKMLKNDILGAPMHLYMLTEIFINNPKTNVDGIFILTDILKYFMKIKYQHYLSKTCCSNNQLVEDGIYYRNEQYQLAAAASTHLDGRFLDQIVTRGDVIGIISKISDGSVVFSQQIYADYFAAMWCVANYNTDKSVMEFLTKDSSKNILFMFNLELCKNSPAHVAVLYRNYEQLERHKNRFGDLDHLKRTPLHLACAHSPKYDPISSTSKFRYKQLEPEETQINQIVDLLVQTKAWDPYQTDDYFKWSILDYAFNSLNLHALEAIHCSHPETEELIASRLKTSDLLSLVYNCINFGYVSLLGLMVKTANLNTVVTTEDYNGESLLYLAIITGNPSSVTILLDQGAKIDTESRQHNKQSPLHLAVACNNRDLVRILLTRGASCDIMDRYRNTPLHLAVERNNFAVAKLLIDGGADVNFSDNFGRTALHFAATNESCEMLQLLVANGCTSDRLDKFGNQPIDYAARNSRVYEFLEAKGGHQRQSTPSRPAMKEFSHYTSYPLHWIAFTGQEDKIESLLEDGWEINDVNDFHRTALHVAVIYHRLEVVKMFVLRGGDVNISDKNKVSPLCSAISNGDLAMAELLLKSDASVDVEDCFGYTPLHWAAMRNNKDLVRLVLEKNPDVDCVDDFGRKPIDCAIECGFASIVELFWHDKFQMETTKCMSKFWAWLGGDRSNDLGFNPVLLAAIEGNHAILLQLLSLDQDYKATDGLGNTALDWACRRGHVECVEVLLNHGADPEPIQEKFLDMARKQRQFFGIFSMQLFSSCLQ